MGYAEALLKALSSESDDTQKTQELAMLPPQISTILFQPQLQFASFKYTRNPRFGVPKDIQVYGMLTQYEHLQYFYDHSPVQNICHGLPIAPFPHFSCLGVYFFVNDLKFRHIVTDGPNAFAITVHTAPASIPSPSPSSIAAADYVYTCWYCCYPIGDSTHTEWIPYQTAHSVSISWV
ncbi:hypothetical protein EON65_36775 [archaeon]|nr:MAG: hypothetical protein EON65_36775 [archaeon]